MTRHPRAIIVINKADLPPAWDAGAITAIRTIATTGLGVDLLRTEIRARFDGDADSSRPRWWTQRQRDILQRALTDRAVLNEL